MIALAVVACVCFVVFDHWRLTRERDDAVQKWLSVLKQELKDREELLNLQIEKELRLKAQRNRSQPAPATEP
jgi:hypothetical protein